MIHPSLAFLQQETQPPRHRNVNEQTLLSPLFPVRSRSLGRGSDPEDLIRKGKSRSLSLWRIHSKTNTAGSLNALQMQMAGEGKRRTVIN